MIDLNIITPDTRRTFPETVFDGMPAMFSDGLTVLTDPTEKSVFMMGALGVISGLIPNVMGLYDGAFVTPNLYVYILGGYGSGKGSLRYARELGNHVHRQKMAETTQAKETRLEGEPEPPQRLHFIPGNSSKTGFFELLHANQGGGTLFESEGDSLADALRMDYGNFSDGLRKAFHHEQISYYRRTGREFVEIDNPRLSVVLTSTVDQLLALIPTAENGLFSRFCYFTLSPDPTFKNVFDQAKTDYTAKFRDIGFALKEIYNFLNGQPDQVVFTFTPDQKTRFLEYFQQMKTAMQNDVSHDLDGLINRLGLQYFRIAMILSTFRHFEADGLNNPMFCGDQDFELARDIVAILKTHAVDVYAQLPQGDYEHKHIAKAENVKKAIELNRAGQTYRQISENIFGTQTHVSTIFRWINQNK
jgi:hypothetical protein